MKKVLFICSQNKLRSPTAEAVFCDVSDWEVRSAGLNHHAEVPISEEDVAWADYIFVMEPVHKRKLKKRFRPLLKNQKIICLNIPDNYDYMDPKLIELLEQRVPHFIY